jgi:hypothetical protein
VGVDGDRIAGLPADVAINRMTPATLDAATMPVCSLRI